ncbi:MAG TPA: MFS transporter [Acetobacteraceae bacterium]|jgi:MFS transporter, OFA family, oxalate/formate antiporter|nr:MFS transporter [Acetobacteraceae bacterium]
MSLLATTLPRRLPFFYGWVILFAVCCAGFARAGGGVAILSVFVEPMTQHFGWSRTAISGAASLGGLLAALSSPRLGRMLDRTGARLVLSIAVLTTAAACAALSLTTSLLVFYLLYCLIRMNFAGPFDLGIYGAVNNWFITRRATANAIATASQMMGLVCLPLIAQGAMLFGGWRAGWIAVGAAVFAVGFLPSALLLVRAPEDLGLRPDGAAVVSATSQSQHATEPEPSFTRPQALRTRAFWLLALFTVFGYPVQAGVSLHQAAYLVERGLTPTTAAAIVSAFSLASGCGSLGFGFLPRRVPIRFMLAAVGTLQAVGVVGLLAASTVATFTGAAMVFGLGIGGLLSLPPVAWADYFGRRSYGAIRGVALPFQVLAQAAGPLLSGIMRDATGNYTVSLITFATLSVLAVAAALLALPPAMASRPVV